MHLWSDTNPQVKEKLLYSFLDISIASLECVQVGWRSLFRGIRNSFI
jgi:hypothetical protein